MCEQLLPGDSNDGLLDDPASQSGSCSITAMSDLHPFSLTLTSALFSLLYFLADIWWPLAESLEEIDHNKIIEPSLNRTRVVTAYGNKPV